MNLRTKQENAPENYRLPRVLRVRKRRNFLYLQRTGKRAVGAFVVLIAKELSANQKQKRHGRVGFTVTKKVGNAVVRNKTKRRLRHVFRLSKNSFNHQDIIILAKPEIVDADFVSLQKDVASTIEELRKMAPKKQRRRRSRR